MSFLFDVLACDCCVSKPPTYAHLLPARVFFCSAAHILNMCFRLREWDLNHGRRVSSRVTHEWKTAVCASADLGLVYVDEDSRMSEGSSSTVAGD